MTDLVSIPNLVSTLAKRVESGRSRDDRRREIFDATNLTFPRRTRPHVSWISMKYSQLPCRATAWAFYRAVRSPVLVHLVSWKLRLDRQRDDCPCPCFVVIPLVRHLRNFNQIEVRIAHTKGSVPLPKLSTSLLKTCFDARRIGLEKHHLSLLSPQKPLLRMLVQEESLTQQESQKIICRRRTVDY